MKTRFFKDLVLVLLVSMMVMPSVNAGVVRRLVEVDPQEQIFEEEEAKKQQEEYKQEAQEQQKDDQEIIEKAKRLLDEQIENIEVPQEEPQKIAAVAPTSTKVNKKKPMCFICRPIGAISGLVVGPISGMFRGAVSKSASYASSLNDTMGDGLLGKVVGYPVGGITGAVTGAITGLANGAATGLVKGFQEPYTAESYSLAEGDYNPYSFLGGQ